MSTVSIVLSISNSNSNSIPIRQFPGENRKERGILAMGYTRVRMNTISLPDSDSDPRITSDNDPNFAFFQYNTNTKEIINNELMNYYNQEAKEINYLGGNRATPNI